MTIQIPDLLRQAINCRLAGYEDHRETESLAGNTLTDLTLEAWLTLQARIHLFDLFARRCSAKAETNGALPDFQRNPHSLQYW